MFYPMYYTEHVYTVASTDKHFKDTWCGSRQTARALMYKYIDKKGLRVVKKYDDTHFKTYICDDGTRFFINRV